MDTMTTRLNAWLDLLPRDRYWCAGRGSPAFRATGGLAIRAAFLVAVWGALVRHLPLAVVLLDGIAAVAAFLATTYLQRLITGSERLVLLQGAWVAAGAVVASTAAARQPVYPFVDVFVVAICTFAGVGRIGCLLVGCCHGMPAAVGLAYPNSDGQTPVCARLRLFPVQAIESAGLLLMAAVGLVVLAVTPSGTTTVGLLASYGILRSGTENLRGDRPPSRRAHVVPKLLAVGQIAAAVVIDQFQNGARPYSALVVVLCCVLVIVVLLGDRSRSSPLSPRIVRHVRAIVDAAHCHLPPPNPCLHQLGEGASVALSSITGNLVHISIATPGCAPGTASRLLTAALDGTPKELTRAEVAHGLIDASVHQPGDGESVSPLPAKPGYRWWAIERSPVKREEHHNWVSSHDRAAQV